jgi:hypothetical protein
MVFVVEPDTDAIASTFGAVVLATKLVAAAAFVRRTRVMVFELPRRPEDDHESRPVHVGVVETAKVLVVPGHA